MFVIRETTGASESVVSDDLIERFIEDAEDSIEEKTGKRFEATIVTDEVHDGNDQVWMFLDHNPIIELIKVVINGVEKDLSDIYIYHKSGIIVLKSGMFSDDYLRNVKISYTWGSLQFRIADQIATDMACRRALVTMAIKESEGAISEKLGSDYTLRYPADGPYAGQINFFTDRIKENLDLLGHELNFGIV